MSVIQALHDSEINARISSFWDSQWSAGIGDEMNGFVVSVIGLESFEECERWLDAQARRLFPDSKYACGETP